MRKAIGAVLIGLGFFGIVLAILLPTVVVPGSKKTPLNLNITQISSGPATVLDPTTNKVNNVQLRATRTVRTDSAASNGTNTTVDESLCIVVITDPKMPNCVKDARLLSLTTDRATANRKSAESVHVAKYNESVNGDTSVRHTGLTYKFPIDAKKQTYQFYQPDVQKAFPATYQGTDKIKGLTVYKYIAKTGDQNFKVAGLFPGTYNDTRTVWVEPKTGAIINGVEQQVQKLDNGAVALDTTLSFEKSAITYQANFAKDKINALKVAQVWAPIGAAILGIAALFFGFRLMRGRRPADDTDGTDDGADDDGPGSGPDPDYHDDDHPYLAGSSSQT